MARIGMNPSRSKKSGYRPARVTAAVLVHIPHLTGYYKDRWGVLQATITSLLRNTKSPFDLLVFDNGSCQEIREYLNELQRDGAIDYLLRSRRNLGKIGAFKVLFRAAPGELVAYCDDDFYYEPGWLEQHLEIIDAYPKVGMVSGYVIPSFFVPERMSADVSFANADPEASLEKPVEIPKAWVADWAVSTGRDPAEALAEAAAFEPVRLEFKNVKAYAAANHDQFLARKEVILSVLPEEWSGHLMGQMIELDEALNAQGYLRLATAERTSRHLGNQFPDEIAEKLDLKASALGEIAPARNRRDGPPQWLKSFLRWRPVRGLLLALYSRLFHWINLD